MIRWLPILAVLVATSSAYAQQAGSPPSSTGDPAAASARNGLNASSSVSGKSPSGSGTSTSGGSDSNNDSGRDKAPGSGQNGSSATRDRTTR
jgi:hypothetical protein